MDAQPISTITCHSLPCSEERVEGKHFGLQLNVPVDSQWLQRYYDSLPSPLFGNKLPFEDYRDAYLFGARSLAINKVSYFDVYDNMEEAWNDLIGPSVLKWQEAEPVIQYAYTRRTIKHPRGLLQLRHAVA